MHDAMMLPQSLVASGSRDALIKLWDARAGGTALHMLQCHKAAVSSLSWHPNGNWLLSASRDRLVKVQPRHPGVLVYEWNDGGRRMARAPSCHRTCVLQLQPVAPCMPSC